MRELRQVVDASYFDWLNLAATFVFGLSGGLAAVRARLDLFGVLVLAAAVGLAGGVMRDVLIGVPPETFRDSRYLAAAGASGVVCFFARPLVERLHRPALVFDAIGLSLFCVTGVSKGLILGLGLAQAVVLGAITGVGGGMVRDVLLRKVPVVLRRELYAIPALTGAAVVAIAHEAGVANRYWLLGGAALCFVMRLAGLHFTIDVPIAPSERHGSGGPDEEHEG